MMIITQPEKAAVTQLVNSQLEEITQQANDENENLSDELLKNRVLLHHPFYCRNR